MEPLKLPDMLEFFVTLETLIEERLKIKIDKLPDDPYESIETKQIAIALSKAQGEFPAIAFNKQNPFYKSAYTDMDTIMRAVRPSLAKNGLSLTQQTRVNADGAVMLHTRLRHASGEWIECRGRVIPLKNDQQAYASALTYQKRYAVMALLNITTGDDDSDDDAEVAMVETRKEFAKGTALNTKYNPKDQSPDTVSKEQIEELQYELAEYPDLADEILTKLGLQSLADLPKNKYQITVNRIREIKNLRNGNK